MLSANWHRSIIGLFVTTKFRSDLNCQIRYMTFCQAVTSDKLTNMAAANVKLSDIPSLNFGPKHLSLGQNQRAILSYREEYAGKVYLADVYHSGNVLYI